uniref:hypothetical protein n=1 Tax=Alloprevotella sp. TaxID=1872471 RepID=UPI003FEDE047
MKLKLKCAIALMLVFMQTSNIMASGVLNPTDEEICLVQVKVNDENNNWTYKRSPQKCPLQLFVDGNKLHFFVKGLPVTSYVRIYESTKETECVSFCIDITSHEEVPLPTSLTDGSYVVIVTVCNEMYKGTFAIQ